MTEKEKLKSEIIGLYFEVTSVAEKARGLSENAGVTAYLKCSVNFIEAAIETLKAEEKDEQ